MDQMTLYEVVEAAQQANNAGQVAEMCFWNKISRHMMMNHMDFITQDEAQLLMTVTQAEVITRELSTTGEN